MHGATMTHTLRHHDTSVTGIFLGMTDGRQLLRKFSLNFHKSPWLGTVGKSWRIFHAQSLLVRYFKRFVKILWEYCSAVQHTTTGQGRQSLGVAWFLTGGAREGPTTYRPSVPLLCKLYKIKSNPMYPLCVYT